MAYPIELTIGTGNKVTINYQSQEVGVSLTYRLERGDTDALAVAREKAPEVVAAHRAAWESVRGLKAAENEPNPRPAPPKEGGEAVAGTHESLVSEIRTAEIGVATCTSGVAVEKVTGSAGKEVRDPSTPGQRAALAALLAQSGVGEEAIQETLIIRFGCESLDELGQSQACEWLLEIQRAERDRVRVHRNGSTAREDVRSNESQNGKEVNREKIDER